MRITILIGLLTLCSLIMVKSQTIEKELIKNPDISWVGESTIRISFENEEHEDSFAAPYEENKLFSIYVMKYSEKVLYELQQKDDFIGNRIKQNQEKSNDISKSEYWYDITLIWYYNEKGKKIESLIKSITPLKNKDIESSENSYSTISMPQKIDSEFNIENKDIIWAKMSSIQAYDFSKIKVLKGDTRKTLKTVLHDNVKEGLYSISSPGSQQEPKIKQKFTNEEMKEKINTNDTNNQNGAPIKEGLDFDKIDLVGIETNWYWDESNNKLACDLNALSPYKSYHDNNGNLLFNIPAYIVDVE